MTFKPIENLPPIRAGRPTSKEIDAVRADMVKHARVPGCLREGLTPAQAKSLRQAIVETPGGHYFAVVRSGRNLPQGVRGPAAVFGGYALDEKDKAQAAGKQTDNGKSWPYPKEETL